MIDLNKYLQVQAYSRQDLKELAGTIYEAYVGDFGSYALKYTEDEVNAILTARLADLGDNEPKIARPRSEKKKVKAVKAPKEPTQLSLFGYNT